MFRKNICGAIILAVLSCTTVAKASGFVAEDWKGKGLLVPEADAPQLLAGYGKDARFFSDIHAYDIGDTLRFTFPGLIMEGDSFKVDSTKAIYKERLAHILRKKAREEAGLELSILKANKAADAALVALAGGCSAQLIIDVKRVPGLHGGPFDVGVQGLK